MAKLEYLANKTNSIREYTIRKEIREWSFNWLEEPDDRYNGMSPCPYARRAWNDDKVVITFKHLKSYWPVFDLLDDEEHGGMLLESEDEAPIEYDSSSLLIPPDDEEIYAMIFIQRLDKLQEAAYKLKPTGYYEAMFKDSEPSHIFELREEFYKRLKET